MKTKLPLFMVLVVVAAIVTAQDETTPSQKNVDPTGTWVWEQSFGGNSTSRVLELSFDEDGELTGVYKTIYPEDSPFRRRGGGPSEISNAKLNGDELIFEVTRKFGDNEFTTTFSCVIVGDELAGFTQMNFGGQVRETEWMAKRVVSTVDASAVADDPDAEPQSPPASDSSTTSDQNPKTAAEVDSSSELVAVPGRVPEPGPETDEPYQPQPIVPGGIVIPIYPPNSPRLNQDRAHEAEKYNMTNGAPGRIQSIVNIHNPSIEIHTVPASMNTGSVVIVAAGGGHRTLNVGTESADFVPYFYNFGINTVILRNRLRSDGYEPETDAVNDAMQAIRLVRTHASKWNFDPNKIGIMGFSAGAELAAPAAVLFDEFDRENSAADDPLAGTTARPDFVGVIYPGPTPFTRNPDMEVPRNTPPAFITCAGAGDRIHAIWADDYFRAMIGAGIPNVEMHIYGNGYHPGTRGATGGLTDRKGIPFGTWPDRFVDWFRDLGFLNPPGEPTKAALDSEEFVSQPPRWSRRPGS